MVMADWFGEWNLDEIVDRARRRRVRMPTMPANLPPYLRRQRSGVANRLRRGVYSPSIPQGVR
jgi:hypothetical protein